MHPDMSKQHIARHDKAMRTVIQAFIKGQCGCHYLIADVGNIEGLKTSASTVREFQPFSSFKMPRQASFTPVAPIRKSWKPYRSLSLTQVLCWDPCGSWRAPVHLSSIEQPPARSAVGPASFLTWGVRLRPASKRGDSGLPGCTPDRCAKQ